VARTFRGLRERQKEQTRDLILDASAELIDARGFDRVTVADVARAAGVSQMTVFNHFPTKEHLFFARMEFFEEELLQSVRRRPRGTSVLDAFRTPVIEGCRGLADPERAEAIARAARLIGNSRTLQSREREIVDHHAAELARLLASEAGAGPDDVEAWGVTMALVGAHRALVRYVRSAVLSGARGKSLARDARRQAEQAFNRLSVGISAYGKRRPG